VMDPYFDATFFEWFWIFISRIFSFQKTELFPDEIQLIVMGLFALSASFLGVLLVLKRLTMMANALSHTMLLGIVVALMISASHREQHVEVLSPSDSAIVVASLAVGFLTGFLIQQLARVRLIKEDASNGMVFSALFALGVTVLSLWSRNAHAGSELLMGDPDALQTGDIPIVFGCLFLRGFSVAIFDSSFAVMSGFRPTLFFYLLLAQVALTSISAFRAVGFVMTLAFFVIPPLIARLWTESLRPLLLWSMCIGTGTVVIAIALGRHFLTVYFLPVSTGALAAVLLAVLYAGALCLQTVSRSKIGNRGTCRPCPISPTTFRIP
jgi:manganese/zinc/iron transport system permease protein